MIVCVIYVNEHLDLSCGLVVHVTDELDVFMLMIISFIPFSIFIGVYWTYDRFY